MEQYISKSAVNAEIKRLLKSAEAYLKYHHDINNKSVYAFRQQQLVMCELLSFLDTLDVKEIDLEDSVKEALRQKYIDYTFKRHNIDPESREGLLIYYAYMHGMNQCLNELNAQKGECMELQDVINYARGQHKTDIEKQIAEELVILGAENVKYRKEGKYSFNYGMNVGRINALSWVLEQLKKGEEV